MYDCGPKAGRPTKTDIQELCPIQDAALKTSRVRWTIGTSGERGSGRSVIAAQHDDHDDDEKFIITFLWNHYNILFFIFIEKSSF